MEISIIILSILIVYGIFVFCKKPHTNKIYTESIAFYWIFFGVCIVNEIILLFAEDYFSTICIIFFYVFIYFGFGSSNNLQSGNLYIVESLNFLEIEQVILNGLNLQNYNYIRSEPYKGTVKYDIKNTEFTGIIYLKFLTSYCTIGFSYLTSQELISQIKIKLANHVIDTPLRNNKHKLEQNILKFLLPIFVIIEIILIYKLAT